MATRYRRCAEIVGFRRRTVDVDADADADVEDWATISCVFVEWADCSCSSDYNMGSEAGRAIESTNQTRRNKREMEKIRPAFLRCSTARVTTRKDEEG